jgi:hypothetical protein
MKYRVYTTYNEHCVHHTHPCFRTTFVFRCRVPLAHCVYSVLRQTNISTQLTVILVKRILCIPVLQRAHNSRSEVLQARTWSTPLSATSRMTHHLSGRLGDCSGTTLRAPRHTPHRALPHITIYLHRQVVLTLRVLP